MIDFIKKNWFKLLLTIFLIIIINNFYQYSQEQTKINKKQQKFDTNISSYKIIDLHTPVEADGFIIISNEYCWYAEEILVHYILPSGHLEHIICNFPPDDVCSKYSSLLETRRATDYTLFNWEWSERLLQSRVIIGELKSSIGMNNASVYYCTLENN